MAMTHIGPRLWGAVLLLALAAAPARAQSVNFTSSFGSAGPGNGQFNHPAAVAVGADGTIVVADTENNRIETFDAAGKFRAAFGGAGSGNDQLSRPSGVAVRADGSILVADASNNRVQLFDASGKYLST